jgi:hypothetical protein
LKKKSNKYIKWLKNLDISIRFIDESHNGGSTELAQNILNYYGCNSTTIQITATYSKPSNNFNIPRENWILWDLEDIKLCKNINNSSSITRLKEKHGDIIETFINKYSIENIINEYSKYPDLWILTDKIDSNIKCNYNYGWSLDSCFLLKQGNEENNIIKLEEFQNENENLKLWYRIFGKRNNLNIPDDNYPDDLVFIKRIEKICKNSITNSRFIGDTDDVMIIMAFLPQNDISKISKATIKLLNKYKVIPDFDILSINSKTTNDPKQSIEEARIKAKNSNKKGLLVLSGRQCSLGVSIDNCDIVILLNNNTSFDMIYQMMFRSMTEASNKKCGFVIDLNINRVIETTIIDYAMLIKHDTHPKDAIKYLLQEKLITLNGDHWLPAFGHSKYDIDNISSNIYEKYSSNTENALTHFLDRLKFKQLLLSKEEQIIFNTLFLNYGTIKKEQKEMIEKLMKEDDENIINKGIKKTKIINDNDKQSLDNDVNYMELLRHIIPLICILTIHNKDTSFIEMFNYIQNNKYILNILLDQTKSWWGNNINKDLIKKFINLYIKYMASDKETNQIIRSVKELFMKNVNNRKELSKLIDKYLIPSEYEKKVSAEVSTPYLLRNEMLDKIPVEFWSEPKKVFEPCCGKGGFIIDILDRFITNLTFIKDEKERYKFIVENCIYFSDINNTNIFITKLLLDPYNEYKLNYNEGNTLELDIKTKWNIDGFDAVIGNPPYNSNNKRTTGVTLWQRFIKKSLLELLNKNGYLCFVNPASWRKPITDKCNFNNELFKLMCHKNQLLYLSIHNTKDGLKTFNCGTRYDWYVIKKIKPSEKSIINDENNKIININLLKYDWLPNYNYELLNKLINSKDKLNVLYSRSAYGGDKKWMSKTKTNEFKYECIHTTPLNNIRYMYSNTNENGHFNISKVILGDSNINPILDYKGNYGLTNHSIGIIITSEKEGNNIIKALKTNKFNDFIKSCSWSNYQIDWRLFTYLKKDFWKEFI